MAKKILITLIVLIVVIGIAWFVLNQKTATTVETEITNLKTIWADNEISLSEMDFVDFLSMDENYVIRAALASRNFQEYSAKIDSIQLTESEKSSLNKATILEQEISDALKKQAEYNIVYGENLAFFDQATETETCENISRVYDEQDALYLAYEQIDNAALAIEQYDGKISIEQLSLSAIHNQFSNVLDELETRDDELIEEINSLETSCPQNSAT